MKCYPLDCLPRAGILKEIIEMAIRKLRNTFSPRLEELTVLVGGQNCLVLLVGSRPARPLVALTAGGALYDEVRSMIDKEIVINDGWGVLGAKIDDSVKCSMIC